MCPIGSGNFIQKHSGVNSLGFTVNPQSDNGLARQLFVLAGYLRPNSCTGSLSASYHGRHSAFWHLSTVYLCLPLRSIFICACVPLRVDFRTIKVIAVWKISAVNDLDTSAEHTPAGDVFQTRPIGETLHKLLFIYMYIYIWLLDFSIGQVYTNVHGVICMLSLILE